MYFPVFWVSYCNKLDAYFTVRVLMLLIWEVADYTVGRLEGLYRDSFGRRHPRCMDL